MFESYIFDEIITEFFFLSVSSEFVRVHIICLLFSSNILQRLAHFIFTLCINISANVCGVRRKKAEHL